jgi:hypothetical protein
MIDRLTEQALADAVDDYMDQDPVRFKPRRSAKPVQGPSAPAPPPMPPETDLAVSEAAEGLENDLRKAGGSLLADT